MKVLDFHMHAFTDQIAGHAIANLEQISQTKACTGGTVKQTLAKMEEWGIDGGVLLPVATKPSQQRSINDWAVEVQRENPGRLWCFGAIHPDAENWEEELEYIQASGLHGVKLHPDYQNFFVDEPRIFPIYEKCRDLKLPIVFHCGFDPLSPKVVHSLPQALARVMDAIPGLTVIGAHLGGMQRWDDVETYLAGRSNLYLDTAMIAGSISAGQAFRIIKKHGAANILFASDCPWQAGDTALNFLRHLPLTEQEQMMIAGENARKLLQPTDS